MGWVLLTVLCGYLVGGIPIGYLIMKRKFGIVLTNIGSGGIGETNVVRALMDWVGMPEKEAKKFGFRVQLLDQLKGVIPILIGIYLVRLTHLGVDLAAVGLILGHCYSPYLEFKGGKAVATTMGIMTVLCWYIALPCYLIWFVIKIALKKRTKEATALASIIGGILVSGLGIWLLHDRVYNYLFVFAASHIVLAHRNNLKRFVEERKGRVA